MTKITLMVFSLVIVNIHALSYAQETGGVLTLEEALALARDNNPAVVEMRKKVQIMAARFRNAKKLTNPELDVNVGKIIHDLENGGTYDNRNLEGEVRINQPLSIWGKRGLMVEIAEDELIQAGYELKNLWLNIARQVKERFYETLLEQKNIRLARDVLERTQRFYELVYRRFNAGKARNHELTRAKLEVAKARNALLEAETNFSVSMGRLNLLLGRTIRENVRLQDNLMLHELRKSMDDLLAIALQERADLLSLDRELSKKEKQLKLARLQKWPDVDLGLFVEREDQIYSVGAAISFELPLWNQYQEDIKEASLEKDLAEIRLETSKKEAALGVYAAYMNAEMAYRAVKNLEQAIEEANELLRILYIDYQTGEATFLAYLEGLTSYREIKRKYLAAIVNYNNKIAELEQAVGKSLKGE